MPPAITVHLVADRTQTIRASVKDVEVSLLITVVLVVVVIFLFLRNARATLIPSAVMPAFPADRHRRGAAAGIQPRQFLVDGLTIAAGFVVDDAIVMLDVIWQAHRAWAAADEAALNGAREISFTILSISISLIAVFTPVMFMGGVVGRSCGNSPITLSAAVIMSILFSLTLTPMLCGQYPRPPKHADQPLHAGARNRLRNALEAGYARGLDRVMRHMPLTLAGFLATAALTIFLYTQSQQDSFPSRTPRFSMGSW